MCRKNGINSLCTPGESGRIFQRCDVGGSSSGLQRFCAGLRAGEADYLMAVDEQFTKNPGADEPGGTCQKNTHTKSPALTGRVIS